ncbi:MAG: family 16 glycoside hydrolase, partial [Pirellulaceae bacterium]
RAYPEMLGLALQRLFPQSQTVVINAGISGHTTQNGLDRLDRDVLEHQPQLVTISFGLNDVARLPPDTFRQNLQTLVHRCRARNSRVLLCTPNMVIDTSSRPLAKVSAYCDIIREVAQETKTPVCDQFAVGATFADREPWSWRLTLSDEIHPNMEGHRRMAEELCFAITGRRVSLADIVPPRPALARTWDKLRSGQPVKVLAMPPFDGLVVPELRQHFPEARIEVVTWAVAGQSLAEIEQAAQRTVRPLRPDLVLIAVPAAAEAPTDEAFVKSYSWIMNWSLSFGQREWDCLVIHPSALDSPPTASRDRLIRELVAAQHLYLLDRTSGDALDSPAARLAAFLEADLSDSATLAEPGFMSLFHGRDLSGWHVMKGGRFSVAHGVIVLDRGGGWLRSDRKYRDFELRLEFRFLDAGANSGIFLRANDHDGPNRAYQVQTMDGDSIGDLYTRQLAKPTVTRDAERVRQALRPVGQWQSYAIMVAGGHLEVLLNGQQVTVADGLEELEGFVGPQGEGGRLEFRHIRIRE